MPATTGSAEELRVQAVYAGPPRVAGFPESLADSLQELGFVVRVPLATVTGIATFHALWQDPLSDDEASAAAELLRRLTQLTSIAERSLREGEQHKLYSILEDVADGVVVVSGGTATPNAAARALLAIPEDIEVRSRPFQPAHARRRAVRPAAGGARGPASGSASPRSTAATLCSTGASPRRRAER